MQNPAKKRSTAKAADLAVPTPEGRDAAQPLSQQGPVEPTAENRHADQSLVTDRPLELAAEEGAISGVTDGKVPVADEASSATTFPPPRTRWAAIIWGLVFAAVAGWALWVLSSTERREELMVWATSLGPTAIVAYVLLALGALVLIIGLTALLHRFQHRRERIDR